MANLKYPEDLKYAESDEWVRVEGDIATLGISDYAQDSLNDIVYIELRGVGDVLDKGDEFGEVESVKANSALYLPFSGEIVEINEELEDDPEIINTDPYGDGWMIKVRITDDRGLDELLTAKDYQALAESR